jgi:hypothetical protein
MATTPEELSIGYSEAGEEIVKELDKVILSRGAWTTILYRYQELERAKGTLSGDKYSIRRYQKRNGEYLPKSKFNISSKDQAKAIVQALSGWIEEAESS